MRRVENIMDEQRGVVAYEYEADGKRMMVRFDVQAVRDHGLAKCAAWVGIKPERAEPVPVFQRGEKIGTLPADFDPLFVKSNSFWYNVRPTDFKREGDRWVACQTICPGDFGSIVGFVPSRDGVSAEPWPEPEELLRTGK